MTYQSKTLTTPRRLCTTAALCLAALLPLAHGATELSQHGITWRFDRDYPTGQFANGDFWVVGPVTIAEITPRSVSHAGAVIHGSMVNPVPNTGQGYDSRIKNNRFEPDKNVAARFPLLLAPGSSLLSSESYLPHATGDHPQLKTIAVLTVLDAPAPEGSFRPPYVAGDKSLRWNRSQLRFDALRSLPRVPYAPRPGDLAGKFARPWIEQGTTWVSRYLHPGENQPTYGREIAHALAEGILTLQLDYPPAEKEDLLVRLVQYGIDVYGSARAGAIWPAGGGHNHGRKMPLMLAATVLGDPDMLAYADGQRLRFQEDRQTFYVTQMDVGRPLYTRDRRPREMYTQADVGLAEWGEKHSQDPQWDGRNWNAYYRTVAGSSTIGHVLAARLMGLQDAWNWPAIFDYYDRYWSIEQAHVSRGANSIQPFVAEMWKTYRHATPAELSERSIATEVWTNSALPPQSGTFTVGFDLLASSANVDSLTGLSRGEVRNERDLAVAVRLAPSGQVEVANGDTFQALTAFSYSAGVRYRVLMTIDVADRRYSVSIAAPGAAPVVIADRWEFRSDQQDLTHLDNVGYASTQGYHAVLDISAQPAARLGLLPVALMN